MTGQRRFRILTPDGLLSSDTFVLPAEQPRNIQAGCVVVVHERSGTMLTVHDSRLFPAGAAASLPMAQQPKSVCLKCGRVAGVVGGDEVTCPTHGSSSCGMLRPSQNAAIDVPSSDAS